jgi:YegS/Rv2252/BmrU family lipid kinase
MPHPPLAIVNPASRSGATGRCWDRIEPRLREALGELQVERTRTARDGERIAREAVRAGVDRLIVAGGDGTISEVVTGLLSAELGEYVQIGLLPLGTGGDLARTIGMPRDLDSALAAFSHGATRKLDAGRVRYLGRDGKEKTSYFLNVASFGISGLVDDLVDRAPKALGGTISFLIGTLRSILRYQFPEVSVRVDGASVHEGPLVLAATANGRFFGGGMQIAPRSQPDDGLFDVVIVAGLSRSGVLANLPSIYRGTHLSHPAVSVHRGTRIEAVAPPGEVWMDIDGDALGTLPASIELLPRAITLFGVADSR